MKLFKKIKTRIFRIFKKHIYVFGDSHTEIFSFLNSRSYNKKYHFQVCSVGGATAQGLRNPNSKTKALEIFKKKIESIRDKKKWLLFSLGEVDTGFVIWYRAEKHDDDIMNQLNISLDTYFEFLQDMQRQGFKKIAVLSAPPPTIEDGQSWGEVANARKDIKATKRERTDLNILYNRKLQMFCNNSKILFLDCDPMLLDKKTNLINSFYLNTDPTNHHLDINKFSNVVYKLLVNTI